MIEINNLTNSPADEKFLKEIAKIVLEGEQLPAGRQSETAQISLALLGPGRIRKLNKKYLGKNRVTDVLAFSENSKFKNRAEQRLGKGKEENEVLFAHQNSKLKSIQGLGEVVICLKEVKKNARRFGYTFEKELARVLIHGILHLLGYDHEKTKKEAKKMREKEEYYLSRI